MKTILKTIFFSFFSIFLLACKPDKTIHLFNGENLDNWNIFVSSEDVNPGDLFWVKDGVINTTGKPHGYIRTIESYGNFKLHVEWRWVDEPTNSGVLIHVQGEDRIWPLAIECQLMKDHAGDLVLIGKGSGVTVNDSTYLVTSEENRYLALTKFEEVSENPAGEWNKYDITCQDGNIRVEVNGVLQHIGTNLTLPEGNILLQSEGSPIQFRNVTLEQL